MTGEPDSARADDDALADAILASFTAAIPVIRPEGEDSGSASIELGGDDEAADIDVDVDVDSSDGSSPGPLAPPVPPLDPALPDLPGSQPEPASRDEATPRDAASRPTVIPVSDAAEAEPWAAAPAPAAAFTSTAQLLLPPADLLDQMLSGPLDAHDLPAPEIPDARAARPDSDAAASIADDGLLVGFAAGDDDLATTLASRLRDLAPPDPAAAVPMAAAPAPPSAGRGAPDAEGAPHVDQDWSAAPPPAFSPPALVEPPSWAAGFAPAPSVVPTSSDPGGVGSQPTGSETTAAPTTTSPEPETLTDPDSARIGPTPVQDAVDLSAFAAPAGPPSGLITLPPEAWLAERTPTTDSVSAGLSGRADAEPQNAAAPAATTPFDRIVAAFDETSGAQPAATPVPAPRLSLNPDLEVPSLIDPRLSAAATSDSAYSDDDDGSVDPEDRVAGTAQPVSGVVRAPWSSETERDDLAHPVSTVGFGDGVVDDELDRPFDSQHDLGLETPAAAAEATTAVSAPARLPRILGIEFGAVEPTPAEQRAGRAPRLFWLAFAPTASLLLLGVGAGLIAAGGSLRQAIIAVLIGAALSALPIALSVLAARWSGQSALVTSRAVFGVVGNALPAVLAAITRIGWAGALLWLTADAVGGLASAAGLGDTGLVRVVALVVGIVLAGLIAVLGYGLLSLVQAIATVVGIVAAAAVIALTVSHIDLTAALTLRDGPWSLVVGGAGLVVAVGGLALVQSIGDLARYQRPGGAASAHGVAAVLGATLPILALTGWGALLAASDPTVASGLSTAPISALAGLIPGAAAVPLLAAVALSGVAGAAVATYSAGLAVTAAGVRAPRPLATVPPALIAALVAVLLLAARVDASSLLRDVAQLLAVPVAAWAGIVGGDLLLRTRRLHTPSLLRRGGAYPDARPRPLAALLALTVLGWLLLHPTLTGLVGFGALLTPLGETGVAAQPGVLVALIGGLIAGLAFGLGAVRRQERAVVEATPSDS